MICNTSPIEESPLEISHTTFSFGQIVDQIFTNGAIYLSIATGLRVKIYWNFSLTWAKDYGSNGTAMALSPDATYLIVGANISSTTYLGKLNSSDGTALASYNISS